MNMEILQNLTSGTGLAVALCFFGASVCLILTVVAAVRTVTVRAQHR